jgi:prolyl-tRNA editing enzyme YbaK/EbsC (Cys-tRNA(Pro) deacylase)
MNSLKPSAQKVQDAIKALGYTYTVMELPDSTRTAAEATAAIVCEVAQIAKSLVFRIQRVVEYLIFTNSRVWD